tara:strand:- start:108 stop:686 length:579 start_codon:yes stop_codon:yes gene_type:complete
MNIRRILENIRSMKAKTRRTYISHASKTSCVELFTKGVKPKAVLEQLVSKIPTLTIEQVRRQYNAFNRSKRKDNRNTPTTPTIDKTLADLVGTSQERDLPVDTRGNQFLASEMSSKRPNTGLDELVLLKDELLEKAELLAELSSIYSKAAIALDTASTIDNWESGNAGSGTVWKQVGDFLKFLKDEQLEKIS